MIGYLRGTWFVHGILLSGELGKIDVLDLSDESFRGWVANMLRELRYPGSPRPKEAMGNPLPYRQRDPRETMNQGDAGHG